MGTIALLTITAIVVLLVAKSIKSSARHKRFMRTMERLRTIKDKYSYAYPQQLKDRGLREVEEQTEKLEELLQLPESFWNQKDKTLRLEAEERQREREEQRRREEERRRRLEEERRQKEEHERLRKEQEDRAKYKAEKNEILQVLRSNRIAYLYHFTDASNLELIRHAGGLFSWAWLEDNGCHIPHPGGGELSRALDTRRGLQNYVRLSFTKNHPMMYVARKEGRIPRPVLLKIRLEAAALKDVLYSDKNATITRETVNIGPSVDDLRRIRFSIVSQPTHFDLPENEKSYYQAEVLVPTCLPAEYIVNLDDPEYVDGESGLSKFTFDLVFQI